MIRNVEPGDAMKKTKALLVCGALAFAVLITLCILWPRAALRSAVSVVFLGQRESHRFPEYVVVLTNNTPSALQCVGRIAIVQGATELERPFAVILAAKSASDISVSSLPGNGPAQVCCILHAVGQPSARVRSVGGLLDQVGVHVYHSSSSAASPLRVRIGRKGSGSLSGFLDYQSSTNSWRLP
jgi:hypothetical protein